MLNLLGRSDLGRDFWLYRLGQLISVIGDSCGGIALAWWILDETGSAAAMASVVAPAMFVKIFMLPLFGPIGDRFPRKWVVVLGDVWRGLVATLIAGLVFLGSFNLPLIVALYVLMAVGSALFGAADASIVPQLVAREKLQNALRQQEAITAFGSIIGGLAGGLLVTLLGTSGAFAVNAVSFVVAAATAVLIRANTRPPSNNKRGPKVNPLKAWARELRDGFRVVIKISVVFWLAMVCAVMNFVIAPIGIALPVLVKEARGMPPWFLGALESSVSVGSVVGAMLVGWLCRKVFADYVVAAGIMIMGLGISVLPWIPNPALPLSMMFFIGIGAMIANIPLNAQTTLAMPDEFRSRTGTATAFIGHIAAPLGTAFAGVMISGVGLSWTMLLCGGALVLLTPLLFLIPKFSLFLRLSPETASTFYRDTWPQAFPEDTHRRR